MDKNNFYNLPLVQAGFPSNADDSFEQSLDLNELVVQKPAATFFVRVEGDSMIGGGIHPGDILVVDRSLKAAHQSTIIALLDGEFTVKKLFQKNGKMALCAENPRYADIPIPEGADFQVWGVVTYVIHKIRPR